jgi:sulfotransferase family protein
MTARRPNFFILGAPKSGTTSLYEYLEGHPDVFMSPVKEPFFFSPDVSTGARHRYRYPDDQESYIELFAGAADRARVGEASTTYLVSRQAPDLIKSFAADALLIAMLRNPVEMVHSLHNERVSQGAEEITDFELALAADDDRQAGRRLPAGATPLGAAYRETAMYGEQLARWIDAFGRARLHVIVFDDFVADTAGQFAAVLRFLGIDDEYRPAAFGARNPSHRLRRGPIRVLLESRPTAFVRRRVLPAVVGEDRAARMARRFRHSRVVRRDNARSPIPEHVRQRLEADFAADVARLSDLLGRDMAKLWFGRPAETAA